MDVDKIKKVVEWLDTAIQGLEGKPGIEPIEWVVDARDLLTDQIDREENPS